MKRNLLVWPLLVLWACGTTEGTRRAEPDPEASAPPTVEAFLDRAAETGLRFDHDIGASGKFYFPEIMGSGVAVIDYDGDGDLDVYLVQGSAFPGEPAGRLNRLFRNELVPTGVLSFHDATEAAGVGDAGYGMGAAVADIDNDGDADLYVTNFGPNTLYRNNGDGTFSDITPAAEELADDWSTSASFVDVDRDGDLDLYVANYVAFSLSNNVACTGHAGQSDYCNPTAFSPQRDRLWRNEGGGRFVDASTESGISRDFGNGLGVTAADFNGDGWQDIYVANDLTPNIFWVNQGDGTFEDQALVAGCGYNADGSLEASMGVTAGDYDGDGDEDLFMTHLVGQTNTIYQNDGAGEFVDVSDQAGLSVPSVPYTGFGTAWFDIDNDTRLDLFIANGAVRIEPAQAVRESYPYLQRNQLYMQQADGRYADVSARSGEAMQGERVSRGVALGDVDNDGAQDIVVSNNNGPVELLINQREAERWLRVKLVGEESNRDGIGARVAILERDRPVLWRRAHTDGSYLSAGDRRVHFGLGDLSGVTGVLVDWPSGLRESWSVDELNLEVELREGSGVVVGGEAGLSDSP